MKFLKEIALFPFTVIYAAIFIPFFAVALVMALVFRPVGKNRFPRIMARLVSKVAVLLSASSVKIIGADNIPFEGKNIVYVCNHQSFFDIPLLLGWIDINIRFVARKNLLSVPILGSWMRLLHSIPIERRPSREELLRFSRISEVLAAGDIIAVFPEGTRTHDGTIGKIHTSSFRPARIAKSTLVPIFIWGSYRILRRGKKNIRPSKVTLVVGEPIAYKDYEGISPRQLSDIILEKFSAMKRQISR